MTDRELLERHKRLLHFDPQYDYRALNASVYNRMRQRSVPKRVELG